MPLPASVIIASYNSRRTIEACLSSLERQRRADLFETLMVDSSTDGTEAVVAASFPQVRLFHLADRTFCGLARNIGAAHAAGDILIFLDADCFVEPDWIEKVLEAHGGAYSVVGGALLNGNPEFRAGMAYHLLEFSLWLPGAEAREQEQIPGACLSVSRQTFERYGPFHAGGYSEDTAFCWRLTAAGIPLLFAPSIRVFHLHTLGMSQLPRRMVRNGHYFAWHRSQLMPRWKRALYAALMPALPPLQLLRIWRRVRGSPWAVHFWRTSPLIALLAIAWSWGEFLGYLSPREPRT